MSRLTWEEVRAAVAHAGNPERSRHHGDPNCLLGNPHYVEGRHARKYGEHYYRQRYGLDAYLRELDEACAANPSDTFRVTFYEEHRPFPTRGTRWDGSWSLLTYREQVGETYSGTNRTGEIDHAAQMEAYRKLRSLGIPEDAITFESEAHDDAA